MISLISRRTRTILTALGFLGIVAFLLTTEHRAHLFGLLPFLLLLACPFLHLFMHGGHSAHDAERGEHGWATAGTTRNDVPREGPHAGHHAPGAPSAAGATREDLQ